MQKSSLGLVRKGIFNDDMTTPSKLKLPLRFELHADTELPGKKLKVVVRFCTHAHKHTRTSAAPHMCAQEHRPALCQKNCTSYAHEQILIRQTHQPSYSSMFQCNHRRLTSLTHLQHSQQSASQDRGRAAQSRAAVRASRSPAMISVSYQYSSLLLRIAGVLSDAQLMHHIVAAVVERYCRCEHNNSRVRWGGGQKG